MKKKMQNNAMRIEEFVHSFEEAQLLRDFEFDQNTKGDSKYMMTIMDFMHHFEEHLNRVVQENMEKFNLVGDTYLRSIEESIFEKSTKCHPKMKHYYYYWERRIYNAIVKMVLRGLLSYKNLIQQPMAKMIPLFQINAEYDNPNLNTHPPVPEMQAILKKIKSNVIESARQFWRWKDGYCTFCEQVKGQNDELVQRHTFYDAVNDNPVIVEVSFMLSMIMNKAVDKVHSFKDMWEDEKKKELWNHKSKMNIEKMIEKNTPTPLLERLMNKFKNMIQELEDMPKERNAFFIQVQFVSVINAFKQQAKDWLDKYGNVVKQLGLRELQALKNEMEEYREKLRHEPSQIDELKQMLNVIAEIRNHSMIMEFKISDVTEKFRTLKLYAQNVDADKMEEAFGLENVWRELERDAKKRDFMLKKTKEQFADVTREQVEEFKGQLKAMFAEYRAAGPGAEETTLDDGLELLAKYKEQLSDLNKRKDELVLAEKLFNLPISTFKELVQIEEENKQLGALYELYREFKQRVKDWSTMLWGKLDAETLRVGADEFDKKRKKLSRTYEENRVFKKIAEKITKFKDSIPLIQQLKSGSITDRHWAKLMKETGVTLEGNIKTLTLEQVFALNL